MTWTIDGRALKEPRTGVGIFLENLLPPLSKKISCSLALPRMQPGLPEMNTRIMAGPALPGSMWFHKYFGSLDEGDGLFCPLGVRPFRTRKRAVVVLHDLSVFLHPGWQSLKNRVSVLPFLEDTVLHSRLIASSDRIRKEILLYFRRADLTTIPFGWDPPRVEAAWGRDPLPPEYFLFLGTMEPRKNPGLLVDLWRRHPELPPLVMAGAEGWNVRLGRMPKNVAGAGYVSPAEKRWLMEHCLALLYPSSYEGFGLPVAEAGAMGVPVIATAVPAVEEYDIPSWVPVELCERSLLDGVRTVLGGKASRVKAALPGWTEVAGRYAEILDNHA